MNTKSFVVTANFLHFLNKGEMEYLPNALLWVENGKVKKLGAEAEEVKGLPLYDFSGKLVMPGFIDGHVHAVQTKAIASYGKRLLHWLEKYVFPLESKFADNDFARKSIAFFLDQLLKNGTTSAAIFPSKHASATAILFEEAAKRGMRILSGKTAMDRHAPENLLDETAATYSENKNLIDRYHQHSRIQYILTPRFAITSTEEQLSALQDIKQELPAIAVQTHVSENREEVETVKKFFPNSKNYLDVYHQYGFLGRGTLMAHAIYLEEEEWALLAETQSSIVHCPTSNLFLGSGLFNLQKCRAYNIPLALGSDVGAGTSFSMLRTAAEAYKIAALQHFEFTVKDAFYLLTLGGANALNIDSFVGNFESGKEADFVVIDTQATELMADRLEGEHSIEEILFVLMTLGDERAISDVFVNGTKINF